MNGDAFRRRDSRRSVILDAIVRRRTTVRTTLPRLAAALVASALLHGAVPAAAQDAYPSKPIRLLVPYPPGGTGDTTARVLVPKWSEMIGQQIVIENRGGAGSNIGVDAVAKSAPDGYMVGFFDSAFTVNPSLYAKLPYDPIRDFAPVMLVSRGPTVLVVNPQLAAKDLAELIAAARSKPGALSYASAGSGTAIHLAAEMLKTVAGIDLVHVPYKGAGPAVQDVVAGQVPMMFALPGTVRGHISSGRMRPIAITGERRFAGLPDVPTFAESGWPAMQADIIIEVMVPARTPAAVIRVLYESLSKTLALPDVRARLQDLAMEPVGADPQRTGEILRAEMEKWAKVVKASGARVE